MNCNSCIWFKYPLLTDNVLRNKPIPAVITDLRRCELGGCDGNRYQARKDDEAE